MEDGKTLKQYCKEAMKRMKCGFWQNYQKDLNEGIERAEKAGISTSKVKQYYSEKVSEDVKPKVQEKEDFYKRVKKLLQEEGEVSNAIGRLTDKEYYSTLSYEDQQRYNLNLSEQYLKAVERYRKEQALEIKV